MRRKLMLPLLLLPAAAFSQSVTQSVNSGAFQGNGFQHSVGEVYVLPANPAESGSGLMAIVSRLQSVATALPSFSSVLEARVYPNPSSGAFRVESPGRFQWAQLTDEAGHPLPLRLASDGRIDLSGRPAGTYFLQLKQNNQAKTYKLIKL